MTDDIVRLAVVVIAVAVVVPLVAMSILMPVGMMGSGGVWHDGAHMYGDTGMGGPWIAWLATVVILLGVGYFVYRSFRGQGEDEAVQELRRAYARGDLSDEEFEKRRKKLTTDNAN